MGAERNTVRWVPLSSFALVSEPYPNNSSTLQMSSQRSDWRERLHANPSRMEQEIAIKLQDNGIHYQTQVEIPITTADFFFPQASRPLLVFVDGRVHLGTAQMTKDEELRSLLRKRGYRILELFYNSYSDKKRDQFYQEIRTGLARFGSMTLD